MTNNPITERWTIRENFVLAGFDSNGELWVTSLVVSNDKLLADWNVPGTSSRNEERERPGIVVRTSLGPPLRWIMNLYRTGYQDYSGLWTTVQDDIEYKTTRD
jgi:hypothetical protein